MTLLSLVKIDFPMLVARQLLRGAKASPTVYRLSPSNYRLFRCLISLPSPFIITHMLCCRAACNQIPATFGLPRA